MNENSQNTSYTSHLIVAFIFLSFIKINIFILKWTDIYNQKQKEKCCNFLYDDTFHSTVNQKTWKNTKTITTNLPDAALKLRELCRFSRMFHLSG